MSSIKLKSQVSGEEIRDLTMQWGYQTATAKSGGASRQAEELVEARVIPAFLNRILNGLSMLAGAATAACLIAWILAAFSG
ncbi:hypothetical protein [Mariniblastus fucicola]|nr:hypothetical protein [Mariniblastus fucicola]